MYQWQEKYIRLSLYRTNLTRKVWQNKPLGLISYSTVYCGPSTKIGHPKLLRLAISDCLCVLTGQKLLTGGDMIQLWQSPDAKEEDEGGVLFHVGEDQDKEKDNLPLWLCVWHCRPATTHTHAQILPRWPALRLSWKGECVGAETQSYLSHWCWTLPMLRLLSSKTQGHKDFRKNI